MTPYWKDYCGHGKDNYICSFEYENPRLEETYDVYIFNDINGNQQVCLRYGNSIEQYVSPGTLIEMISMTSSNHMKQQAVKKILEHGTIKFEKTN